MSEVLRRLQAALADRYAVESEIGRGAMATVYVAKDVRHGRRVAIKVLDPDIARSIGKTRFLREIEIVAGLDHPHVVPLHDSGEANGLLFYVMPYVAGESLRDRLQREGPLPVDDALRIAGEVADALAYAHRRGVIHRDIKPANILLSEGHARVADFGVARALETAVEGEGTAAGLAVGTPAYMSPEQAAGEEVDGRSDLYALGCLMYEMLAGEPPLVGPTARSTAARRLTDRPTPLPALRETVPRAVDALVETSLRRAPADRFQTAGDFAAALDRAASPSSDTVPTRGRATRASRWRPVGVAAGLAVLLLAAWQILPRLAPSHGGPASSTTERDASRSIAVLPFENLAGDEADAPFVDGVHVEILTRLAGIRGISPISRASVLGYRAAPKSAAEVAKELNVALVLEGSVQRTGDRIRVIVQLVDDSGRVVWAEPYDRALTAENLFAIQSEIARQVTRELGAQLSPAELRRIDRVPTDDLAAYDYWVRGYHQLNGAFNSEAAARLFEEAIARDSGFAGAWSALGVAYTSMFWESARTDDELCEQADRALARARELDPDLPELHIDTGWYHYRCFLDYDRALASLDEALRLSPNNVEALEVRGLALRRSGRIRESVAAHERAVELSPRYGDLHWHLASSYSLLRNFESARLHGERAISLNPSNAALYLTAAWIAYRQAADPEAARVVLRRGRAAGIDDPLLAAWDAWLALRTGEPEVAIEAATEIPRDSVLISYVWYPPVRTRAHFLSRAHRLRGDESAALTALERARSLLAGSLAADTTNAHLRSSLGVVLAEMGRVVEAGREGRRATEQLTLEMDAWAATYLLENLAQIYAQTGRQDEAIDLLRQLLAIPGDLTREYLLRSPTWESLRDHPRFLAEIEAGSD